MKRLPSSDSLLPVCHSDEIASLYNFPSDTMGPQDDEECLIAASSSEKKRRLSAEQVKVLEKNFEVENKLEPERKAQLAHELGLQPRQVAVWFQNRRARWKAKNLEREYGDLKNSYDALRTECDALKKDRDGLLAQIKELKSKRHEGETDNMSFSSVKEEPVHSESDDIIPLSIFEHHDTIPPLIFKDGSSDSDSSAVLNEKTDQKGLAFETCVHKGGVLFGENRQNVLKMEDDVFLEGEVPCSSLFHEEQPPSLSWYYSTEQWN